jgi:uncharacterized SAM-binding protein YcdF (DUF218 family)
MFWKYHFRKRVLVTLLFGICFSVALHFAHFLSLTSLKTPPEKFQAEGIVAMTGGADRINVALDLLNRDHSRRLLISGVHPIASADDLARLSGHDPALFACCVDLDKRARNTIDNARETARWAQRHGLTSLVIVTSHYHLPRTMLELRQAMPKTRLTGYPVKPELNGQDALPRSLKRLRIIVVEYMKYLLASGRLGLISLSNSFDDSTETDL